LILTKAANASNTENVVPDDNEAFQMQALHMSSQGKENVLDGMMATNFPIKPM
jgi:hypothetical protein